MEFLGNGIHISSYMSTLADNAKTFSKEVVAIYIPIIVWEVLLIHIFDNACGSIFNFSKSQACEVLFHCDFNLYNHK